MTDYKTKVENPDRDRISVNERYDLRAWSSRFGVSQQAIMIAVGAVGDKAADVEAYLKRKK
jgi:hypothetical protein